MLTCTLSSEGVLVFCFVLGKMNLNLMAINNKVAFQRDFIK